MRAAFPSAWGWPLPAALALLIMCCASNARAEVKVVKANGSSLPEGAATITFNPATGGWNVELLQLYAPGFESVFEVRANAGEIIDQVLINVNGPAAGSPVVVRVYGEAPGFMSEVKGIFQIGTAETILNKVNVTVDVGPVIVEAIGDIIAGRDVIGPIIATTADNPARGITTVQAARHILNDVNAENGRILLVWAQNGNIGSEAAPINIRAKHNVYHVMGQDVHASVNTRANGGAGGLWALVADRFFGSVECEKLIFNPWNGVNGLVLIHDEFAGTISIGKSYNNPLQYIQVPTFGLSGQVIINADNAAGGTWAAPVRIGPQGDPNQVVLNGPRYSFTDAYLGGGAVGLVPFRLHDESCVPANGGTAMVNPKGEPLTIELRHFGPVTLLGDVEPPVTIERRLAGTGGNFAAVPSSGFAAMFSNENANSIVIGSSQDGPGFEPGYQYRIRPTAQLVSDVPALAPVIWEFDYVITVQVPPCDGDIDADGGVNVNDLILVINFWGGPPPAFLPGVDGNNDGVVNVNDLLLVINNWGPCW